MPVEFSRLVKPLKSIWLELSLARQFALVSSIILVFGMIIMGVWVSNKIEAGVTQNTASATVLYMDSFIAPVVQELFNKQSLSRKAKRDLNNIFIKTLGKNGIVSLKIWARNGKVVFSNHIPMIGSTFPITKKLSKAWEGGLRSNSTILLMKKMNMKERQVFLFWRCIALFAMRKPARSSPLLNFMKTLRSLSMSFCTRNWKAGFWLRQSP